LLASVHGEEYNHWVRRALTRFETGPIENRRMLTDLACLDEVARPIEPDLEPPKDYLVGDWRAGP
jgi:hypothetical protein